MRKYSERGSTGRLGLTGAVLVVAGMAYGLYTAYALCCNAAAALRALF
jgi:hypothetical protein